MCGQMVTRRGYAVRTEGSVLPEDNIAKVPREPTGKWAP